MQLPTLPFSEGRILCEPIGSQPGYWAGAPGLFRPTGDPSAYLTYRIRRPRGVPPDRGGEARIARCDGERGCTDLWKVHKDQLGTASMERSALHQGPDGRWHYYLSYVDPSDDRWCVARITAQEIKALDPAQVRPLFNASMLGLEGVKDPFILKQADRYWMFLSVALPTAATNARSHATRDIFNTGECLSGTGLAVSTNLDHWDWQGVVFAPAADGWDSYCRRINSVIPLESGDYLGFYDGSQSVQENYEERTGLCLSPDLREWRTLTPRAPAFTSPYASGSLRYLDAHAQGQTLNLYYEWARSDGAHDLRTLQTNLADFVKDCQ